MAVLTVSTTTGSIFTNENVDLVVAIIYMTGSYKVVAYKFSCLQGKILCMFTNNNNQVGDKRHA